MLDDAPPYMIALLLRERPVVVVGGGPIATDKVEKLLVCGARVTVVAPEATGSIQDLAHSGSLRWVPRAYAAADLSGVFLVVAATDDPELNARAAEDARAARALVNVVDVPQLSDFIAPAITRIGPISVAVSTSGASPALAKRIRREIHEAIDEPYARLAILLEEIRGWARATLPTYAARRDLFEAIVDGSPDPIDLLRQGREQEVRELIADAQSRAEQAATSDPARGSRPG